MIKDKTGFQGKRGPGSKPASTVYRLSDSELVEAWILSLGVHNYKKWRHYYQPRWVVMNFNEII